MPITFEDIMQTVINTVRERELALLQLQQANAKITELEKQLNVRLPDNPNINPKPIPLKEVK